MRSERIDLIEKYILEHKTVSLDTLCMEFEISKNTLRRDIDVLVKRNTIKKVYGGVTSIESKDLISFDERDIKNKKQKDSIAEYAGQFIDDNDTIFIDSGTTTSGLIESIKNKNVTILTNNLKAIIDALPYENLNIISLSGSLNRKTNSFTSGYGTTILSNYNINKSFMACTGLSLNNGVTNSSRDEFEIKKVAISKSEKNFLLADDSKFDRIALMTFATIDDFNVIITNGKPDKKFIEYFNDNDIELLITK